MHNEKNIYCVLIKRKRNGPRLQGQGRVPSPTRCSRLDCAEVSTNYWRIEAHPLHLLARRHSCPGVYSTQKSIVQPCVIEKFASADCPNLASSQQYSPSFRENLNRKTHHRLEKEML